MAIPFMCNSERRIEKRQINENAFNVQKIMYCKERLERCNDCPNTPISSPYQEYDLSSGYQSGYQEPHYYY